MTVSVDISDDELNISARTVADPSTFYKFKFVNMVGTGPSGSSATSSSSNAELRRSTRQKKSLADANNRVTGGKRKRSLSASASSNQRPKIIDEVAKKRKLDATQNVNLKREARDAARSRWLFRHRHLFEPLLPRSNHTFFNNLKINFEKSGVEPCISPYNMLESQPKLIKRTMKNYQLEGLSFLAWMYQNGMNCILGDEMGLGKTLQTLSLFAYISEHNQRAMDPHLVICPLSVLSSWESEAARWLPSFRTTRFHGPVIARNQFREKFRHEECDLMITTYETFVAENSWFKSRRWTYCVLDEGHKIKNSQTNIASKVQNLGTLYRLILTGTPLQNNLTELWGLLRFLYPSVFTPTTEQIFTASFDMKEGIYDFAFLKATKELLSTVMMRRTKAILDLDIPPREEYTVFLPLAEAQRFWTYRLLTSLDQIDFAKVFGNGSGRQGVISDLQTQNKSQANKQFKRLQNLLMQLRQVCNHPYVLDDALPEPYGIGEHIVSSSAKLMAIDKLLSEILPKGERVLIFSQFTRMLDILEDFMQLRGISCSRLDGSTIRPRRTLDIKLFQRDDCTTQVFLISTRAGGLGINLTKATTVVMCDSDWNPQNDLQAIARAHRIGQKRTVKVYRLICRATVEDQMLDRIRRKLFLSVKVMSGNRQDSDDTSSDALGMSELMDILQKGSSALASTDDGMSFSKFITASFAEVIEASKSRQEVQDAAIQKHCGSEADHKLIHDAVEEERKLLSGVARVKSRLFEGQLVQRSTQDIADEWREMQKRARTNRLVQVDGMAFELEPQSQTSTNITSSRLTESRRGTYDWEDYCIYCRDGGELIACSYCPRVFHPNKHCANLSKAEMKKPLLGCSQHACVSCSRGTAECGGMLFRCRTCPVAFCEDCLPQGDEEVEYIGDTIPEFQLLGFGATTSAYFIRCLDCIELFKHDSQERREWEEQFSRDEKRLKELQMRVDTTCSPEVVPVEVLEID